MKTNNLYITLFAALAITACSKDNELLKDLLKTRMPICRTHIPLSLSIFPTPL